VVDRDVTKVTGGRKNPVRGYWWWWWDCAPRCAGRLPASRAAAPWEGFGDVCAAQTKWGPTSLPTPTIRSCSAFRHPAPSRSTFLAISGPQNDALRRTPEQPGDGLVGPLSGAGRTWKALHHLFLRLPKQSLSKRWTAFPVPDRVRINSWESLRSVTRLPVDFLASPIRSLLASLATTLDVPAVLRLRRPMIGS
jgi:hypothetical protein